SARSMSSTIRRLSSGRARPERWRALVQLSIHTAWLARAALDQRPQRSETRGLGRRRGLAQAMIGRLRGPATLAPLTGAAPAVATLAAAFASPAAIARSSAVGTHPRSVDLGSALAIGRDGKPVVAGVSRGGSRFAGALARYTANGRLDPAFGAGGRVLTNFGSPSSELSAVAVQADGKIVVAGGSYDPRTGV